MSTGAFRLTGRYGISRGFPSLRLDAGGLDHLRPLLGFVGDELTEVGGREREHVAAQVGKLRLDFRVGERGPTGLSGVTICEWKIDRARYVATPVMSDGREGPPLELRGLFEQFLKDAG